MIENLEQLPECFSKFKSILTDYNDLFEKLKEKFLTELTSEDKQSIDNVQK